MGAIYLNTDLDLRARVDLGSLDAELCAMGLIRLHFRSTDGLWAATYQTARDHRHPSQSIRQMVETVRELSPEGQHFWKACLSRQFNIGYHHTQETPWNMVTGSSWSHNAWQFTPDLLYEIASVNGSLVVTLYPPTGSAAGTPG